ncbi:hypothetical protein WJX81_003072 [Elliptochloris bilobata]|uniref:Zinc finger protein n=1 Tax=Elliptochloris bilobata TaxID=381761 RepID=A0AAW1S300_9CHLO
MIIQAQDVPGKASPPIKLVYFHFHNAIRAELDSLADEVLALEPLAGPPLLDQLRVIKERYQFLEQVYSIHSSVEDEVVYPALDAKVKNVTLAYSVEHEDEERLFEQLMQLLASAAAGPVGGRGGALRQLSCKAEEIYTTLRKHLAKEEEQLFPLLLAHFSFAEQTELVAQFLCCIPLAAVEAVLAWLKPAVPQAEQEELLAQVRMVIKDRLLLELLVTWLSPAAPPACVLPCPVIAIENARPWSPRPKTAPDPKGKPSPAGQAAAALKAAAVAASDGQGKPGAAGQAAAGLKGAAGAALPPGCCRVKLGLPGDCGVGAADADAGGDSAEAGGGTIIPLQHITHLHAAIRSALDAFAAEAAALRAGGGLTSAALAALVERHRFLRAVCAFHSASENDVVFPAARRLAGREGGEAFQECEAEHACEGALLEDLGRLLGDVRASARRGSAEAVGLTAELAAAAGAAAAAISGHMAREEAAVLPLLTRSLCRREQRAMVWRTLRAMPLRLLERVLPWLAGKLSEEDACAMTRDWELAAPADDCTLVSLLSGWAARGRQASPEPVDRDDPIRFSNETCGVSRPPRGVPAAAAAPTGSHAKARLRSAPPGAQTVEPAAKRARKSSARAAAAAASVARNAGGGPSGSAERPAEGAGGGLLAASGAAEGRGGDAAAPRAAPRVNPIDHIFQFHKALRRDLRSLEEEARAFAAALDEAVEWRGGGAALQALEGRYRFLWGIYCAHSEAEDAIVFPALEAKEALRHVSHAYTLDHQQEAQLFQEMAQVLQRVRSASSLAEARAAAAALARLTAATRASLEQHVRAEEQELWPLFAENFSEAEQQHLVGVIVGRTGAEVLQAMLPWVTGSCTEDEQAAMMSSLRSATRNTGFERWLGVGGAAGGLGAGGAGVSPAGGDIGVFRPGWEDIFRMNQTQLEETHRRVCSDASLAAERKAYLMQNIMASRYIVAQQRRLASGGDSGKPTRSYHNAERGVLGCPHYQRKCQVVAPCCGQVHACRFCHDEAEDHRLDPHAVTSMVCMACNLRQPASGSCSACGQPMARYYCGICHLWDDEPAHAIYHCPFCNLCRRGRGLGVDACHCMDCNSCMHLSEFARHKCRDLSACPVCTDYLFDSAQPYRELPCGHFMHSHCFAQYARYNYTCPVCVKSMGDMSVYFRMLDSLLARDAAELPPAYAARRQVVMCNDCGHRSEAPFHFVYHKCGHCASYNTRVV